VARYSRAIRRGGLARLAIIHLLGIARAVRRCAGRAIGTLGEGEKSESAGSESRGGGGLEPLTNGLTLTSTVRTAVTLNDLLVS
jgi:hypothetical protein